MDKVQKPSNSEHNDLAYQISYFIVMIFPIHRKLPIIYAQNNLAVDYVVCKLGAEQSR
jgi:hypothetical protein